MFFREMMKVSVAIGSNNYDAAIGACRRMLDKDKEDYFAASMIAMCYEWKGDIVQAISYAEKLLNRFPNDFEMLLLCARCWSLSGDEDRTYQFVTRALDNYIEEKEQIPKWLFLLMKPLSIFKKFRGLEEKAEKDKQESRKRREEQLNWAKEFKARYEAKSP